MIWVFFAHYIGDFGLQKEWIALNKHKYWYILFAHAVLWSACVCIALEYSGRFELKDATNLVIGHFMIDKYTRNHTRGGPNTWIFYLDQVLHLIQCLFAWSM